MAGASERTILPAAVLGLQRHKEAWGQAATPAAGPTSGDAGSPGATSGQLSPRLSRGLPRPGSTRTVGSCCCCRRDLRGERGLQGEPHPRPGAALDSKGSILAASSRNGTAGSCAANNALLFVQCVCLLYSAYVFVPGVAISSVRYNNASTVELCPRASICSEGWGEILLLFASRGSAYFMYPLLGTIFVTKCHSLNHFLSGTILSVSLPLADLHNRHVQMGCTICVMTWVGMSDGGTCSCTN